MVRNRTVLETLQNLLALRGISLEAWESEIGWDAGSTVKALQPPDEHSINRNIKLIAHKLDMDGAEFFELLAKAEKELR